MLVVDRRLREVALVWIFCRVVLTHVSLLSNLVFGGFGKEGEIF